MQSPCSCAVRYFLYCDRDLEATYKQLDRYQKAQTIVWLFTVVAGRKQASSKGSAFLVVVPSGPYGRAEL